MDFPLQEFHSLETVAKSVCIIRINIGRNRRTYTVIQSRYISINVATGYTRSTWHPGRLSKFTSNKIASIVSERGCSVTEQF